jgi:NADP-dependent 3-hydroxy acid dehydrogenase YdfG
MQFKGKTVIVTGASAGFGCAIAKAFAREGARLIIVARREDRLEELARELQQTYQTEVYSLILDVSEDEKVREQLSSLPAPFNVPDILVNNAGLVRGLGKLWEVTPEEWNQMIDTNIKGVLSVTSQILPIMLEANKGHIINVGSISGYDTYPGGGVYCATKFAVRALTETLRKELVATPLRVSMISPGIAETEFSMVRFYGNKQKADDVYKNIQALKAEDIAEMVIFIASRPPHVAIADLIVYPTNQASVSLIHRSA